jgi:hypothetical protein
VKASLIFAIGLALASLAPGVAAQPWLEVAGEIGYTRVNVQDWLGAGTYDADYLNYGGSVAALVGSRGPRGIQVGVEAGLIHMITYYGFYNAERRSADVNAWRLLGLVRYWPGEAEWFLEFAAGINTYGTTTDPTFGAGAGGLFDIAERWSVLAKGRLMLISSGLSPIVPIQLQTGLVYQLGR